MSARTFPLVLVIAAALAAPNLAGAQSLDAHERGLELIVGTADRICNVVSLEGQATGSEVSGKVNAELKGLASNLVAAGVSAAGSRKGEQYQNVLQQDLAATLKDNAACKLKVFQDLKDKFLPNSKPLIPAPVPAPVILPSSRGAGPSFPCSKASNAVERLICANDGLAELDVKLSNAYHASLQQLSSAGQQQLKRDQFQWLQRRNACEDYGCVERAYRNRLSALEAY